MGRQNLGQDSGVRNGLAVSRSGWEFECLGWLYLDQDMGVSV
jgi:hypothetical protein